MTVRDGEDPALPEQLTRDEEMYACRREVLESMKRVAEYRSGNTQLLEALMRAHGGDNNAPATVCNTLLSAGMLDFKGVLNWEALKARRAAPWTWQDAVRMLVKQPAERDRILALDDTPRPDAANEDKVSVLGVRADGSSEVLGTAPMPAAMKRRDIVREQFGEPSADQCGTDADMCLWAMEQYHDWLVAQGWTAPALSIEPATKAAAGG